MSTKSRSATYQIAFLMFSLGSLCIAQAYDPLECLDDVARVDSEIVIGLATKLCSGAWTSEPVKCYQSVAILDDKIPRGIAIDLCAGSENAEQTLSCYYQAGTKRQLNRGLSTTLCSARKSEL